MPVDYSKWNHIEVSDDEDDTHPNIDTPSLFKWRHEARVQRMEEMEKKKKNVDDEKKKIEAKLKEIKERVAKEEADGGDNLDQLKASLQDVEKQSSELEKKKMQIMKEEKSQPLNVDTLSKDGFSKCIINSSGPRKKEALSDEEREKSMKKFVKENEKLMKEYGMLKKFDDSKRFLQEHTHLACDETANYLVIWCLDLEMEDKRDLMEHVAHQCICMQYLLELAKQLETDPRACISSFFSKIQIADQDYKNSFYSELEAFKDRIKKRAQEKIAEALEEERQERLGPGGLDPVEVFESLPDSMKECFESQNIPMLQQVIKDMPEEEARHHMKRCVDSGLWVPSKDDPGTNTEDGFVKKDGDGESEGEGEAEGEGEESHYAEVK
eukprot:TRINITY_DN9734_c0_g1_i1.p1 TRINITY_DN9734_c0_g1~~TRINITY_DN9734_c0_g1_i1.p1  ORF type:complete len:382 (+),score=166.82 TRINITY_DN9734_c0_g1_i1:91-1236(+)